MSTNNIVLNRLFTQYVFKDLIDNHSNNVYGTVVKRYINDPESKENGVLISEIYKLMSKSYRNEYFYLNTLLNKLLLGRHSVNTTTALTQIPIGKSRADFILINGKAVVYEIKTELDTFERLDTQLKDYYKAFNQVCVVTSASNFEKLSTLLNDTPVGIYVLTKESTLNKQLRKEPKEKNEYLSHKAIFKILHKGEFESIILSHYGYLPMASQVFYYDECFVLFTDIPVLTAYAMALDVLKKRNRILIKEFRKVPYELKSLMYFLNISSKDLIGLNHFLRGKFGG